MSGAASRSKKPLPRHDVPTDEERELFEQLADDLGDDPLGEFFHRLAQSDDADDDSDREVANS